MREGSTWRHGEGRSGEPMQRPASEADDGDSGAELWFFRPRTPFPIFNGEGSVEKWRSEVEAVLAAYPLQPHHAAGWLRDAVRGVAREELSVYPYKERRSPDGILKILQRCYGDPRSLARAELVEEYQGKMRQAEQEST